MEEFVNEYAKVIIIVCIIAIFIKQLFFKTEDEKRKIKRDYDKFFNQH